MGNFAYFCCHLLTFLKLTFSKILTGALLTVHADRYFFMILFVICRHFSKLTFSKKSFRSTIRESNSLDLDQDQHNVGPDLGPNCLQRFSAGDKSNELIVCL